MKLNIKCLFLVFFALSFSFAQDNDQVLLTVNGEPVMASEFLRVYNKNLDLVQDESQKDIDGYLKLFTEYQLKLKEAKRLKLDEDKNYQREFLRYKKQLIKNYISENKVTEALVKEAYDRSNIDINASHILVRLDATSKDTLNAYNEVLALRERALKEGFDKVKAEMHNGKTIFLENLGYFSAFKMVYEFETAAYNTNVGEISMPFRTQFGYHVVKVDDKRSSRGTATVAHIMVNLVSQDSLADPEKRINDIYKKLNQGESFESLAKQFSEDKSSAREGGKIAPFKSGQLSSLEFEDAAFALKNDGDVTQPFKTAYGWHIVKRINLKPIEPLENLKESFESKVKRDSRSKLINEAMITKLKNKYDVTYNSEAKGYFTSILTDEFYKRNWNLPAVFKANETLFSINETIFTYEDFGKHLITAQRIYSGKATPFTTIVEKEYESFIESSILQYREDNLEVENIEYANILKEYRDGLLLFDLMEKEIWNKASQDSTGIESYYGKNKSKYQWSDRVEVVIASSADKSNVKKALKMMKKGNSEAVINEKLNTNDKQNVIFTKGTYTLDNPVLPSGFKATKGVSAVYEHHDAFHVIDVVEILPAGQKSLDEAKGNVINDYQTEIETNWVTDLYARFNVEVNQETLNAIKAKIGN
ncbi:peptidyl-prolyl cis-trans isomerase SurA [Winogradskyella pacifica]|uniref:Peptidyl-prolyl cis-trans isomerase SurA n=1 Tax=Winogradskyella pacifica TaxID=664642 RepID=A0A3D9N2K4_9FLAO|nr:peptidylprolyl isomerase [Winogradskyella pacifica]REE25118.1 peptidyl-prolyl cis-trans isomerase SurA [Winogradskyella pacifica]